MNTVLPIDTTHTIKILPRFYPIDVISLSLFNEGTQVTEVIAATYTISNGIMSVTFDFDFLENAKYQIKISENANIAYRGKLIASSQVPQEYKSANGLYYYE